MPSVLESLNSALHRAFTDDQDVYLLGEDILDPYGGAFKVTQGLSTSFPDRVLTTPISEAGFVGVAAGMAMRGMHPVVEIMFGDFITLAADQLVNHIAKFRWMATNSAGQPLYGHLWGSSWLWSTHSQTLKTISGVPVTGGRPAALVLWMGESGALLYHSLIMMTGGIHRKQAPIFITSSEPGRAG
jgi:pyruvate/2-oxoglutarate/acetoin dehydrogenase E1 component